MDDPRWTRLLDYVRRARLREFFDSKERMYRLEAARELRRILELAAAGAPWVDELRALTTSTIAGRPYDLTERSHQRWLQLLADRESLGRALGCFLEAGRDHVERFDAFVQAAGRERPTVLAPPESLANPDIGRDDPVLAMGSLFNFACAPEHLPVIRPQVFDVLEQTLGCEWTYRLSLTERYKRHVAFAEDVMARFRAADIPVRDMLDAQSLIQDAGEHADFWTGDSSNGRTSHTCRSARSTATKARTCASGSSSTGSRESSGSSCTTTSARTITSRSSRPTWRTAQ